MTICNHAASRPPVDVLVLAPAWESDSRKPDGWHCQSVYHQFIDRASPGAPVGRATSGFRSAREDHAKAQGRQAAKIIDRATLHAPVRPRIGKRFINAGQRQHGISDRATSALEI